MATLADYTASSNRRIQTKDAALTVAIEMLEKISTGRSYDSLEFLSLVARMKEIQAQVQAAYYACEPCAADLRSIGVREIRIREESE